MKKGLLELLLIQWKSKVSECIEEKIEKLQFRNICPMKKNTPLWNKLDKKALKDLHDRSVITPIDKANSSVVLIYKRFYALTLFREPGINN